jgi:hypothetical protein
MRIWAVCMRLGQLVPLPAAIGRKKIQSGAFANAAAGAIRRVAPDLIG